jgi:LysR family transcriptional regulator for metE and metH
MFLELRHLRSLWAIREEGNLARAAGRLHLTQSALSHQIKAVEGYFGTPLFHRNSKPLRLTAAGQQLVALAQQVLPAVEQAEAGLHRLARGEAGRLHIAIECHACFEWLLPVLEAFRGQWPDVEVDIRVDVNLQSIPALQKGEIDVVISSDPQALRDVFYDPLFDYEARLVLAAAHPLRAKSWIATADLAGETLISYPVQRRHLDVFRRFLQPAGIEPARLRPVELTAVMLLLVASQRGVAVLPDWVVEGAVPAGNLITRPLGEDGLHGTVYAARRAAERELPWMNEFVALARAGRGL